LRVCVQSTNDRCARVTERYIGVGKNGEPSFVLLDTQWHTAKDADKTDGVVGGGEGGEGGGRGEDFSEP
jgi:hypothetical protein